MAILRVPWRSSLAVGNMGTSSAALNGPDVSENVLYWPEVRGHATFDFGVEFRALQIAQNRYDFQDDRSDSLPCPCVSLAVRVRCVENSIGISWFPSESRAASV